MYNEGHFWSGLLWGGAQHVQCTVDVMAIVQKIQGVGFFVC